MISKRLRSRKPAAVTNSRWVAYATAGAATTLAMVAPAEADITYSGPLNEPFNNNQGGFALGDSAGLTFGHFTENGVAGFYISGALSAMFRGTAAGDYRYPSRLGSNVNVSAGDFVPNVPNIFATLAFGSAYGNFLAPGQGFVGFRFNGGSGVQHGWVRLNMAGSGNGNTFTVVDYAFASPGEMITTGQTAAIPEPGSLALLALGAAGLVVWRQRRSKAA